MSKPINLDALFKQARQKEPYYGGKDFVSRVAVDIGRQKKLSKTKEAIIIGSAAVIGATITYDLPIGQTDRKLFEDIHESVSETARNQAA